MKLSSYTDYALRVLIYLGINQGRLCSIAEIARAHAISENHLMKVVQHLGNAGVINTFRGRKGGLSLAQPPDGICIGDVVRSTETRCELLDCGACRIGSVCKLRGVFAEALDAFYAVLDSYTLKDLLRPTAGMRQLLTATEVDAPAEMGSGANRRRGVR